MYIYQILERLIKLNISNSIKSDKFQYIQRIFVIQVVFKIIVNNLSTKIQNAKTPICKYCLCFEKKKRNPSPSLIQSPIHFEKIAFSYEGKNHNMESPKINKRMPENPFQI